MAHFFVKVNLFNDPQVRIQTGRCSLHVQGVPMRLLNAFSGEGSIGFLPARQSRLAVLGTFDCLGSFPKRCWARQVSPVRMSPEGNGATLQLVVGGQ